MNEMTAEIIESKDSLEVRFTTDDGIVVAYDLPIEMKNVSDDEIIGICAPRAIEELSGVSHKEIEQIN